MEQARREMRASRELADAGRAARDLAHDLGNLVAVLHLNLQQLDWDEREKARQTVDDVQQAALAVYRMFAEWRGGGRRAPPGSSAVLLTTLSGLLGRTGIEIVPRIDSALPFVGRDEDVVRVLENLLLAASREAIRAGDPRVVVEMTSEQLRIESRIREPERLEQRIYEEGGSFEGSTGRGLTIAREAAARVRWHIVHAVDQEGVAFVVRPL